MFLPAFSFNRDSSRTLRPARTILGALLAASISATCATFATAQPREAAGPRGRLSANVERVDSMAGITEYRLKSNGMNVLLVPNRSVPVVTFLVVYHVGSRNEWPGATG